MSITIRLVDTVESLKHFNMLEHLVWGTPLDSTIPLHVLVTTIHNGGGLLAAYAVDGPDETGGMVGITYWWPGLDSPTTTPDAKVRQAGADAGAACAPPIGPQASSPASLHLKMCSHMAGVLPAWRGARLGLRLKLAQRAAILAQGMTDWVTWTYDPLIRTNAALNLHRLGTICNTYHVNLYGEMRDGINAGTPSDRCQVDWWLTSARVEQRAHDHVRDESWRARLPPGAQTFTAGMLRNGFLTPPTTLPTLDGSPLALPLPDDIYVIRDIDNPLSMAWRLWLREALQSAFAAGYLIIDCVHHEDGQWRYLLTAGA